MVKSVVRPKERDFCKQKFNSQLKTNFDLFLKLEKQIAFPTKIRLRKISCATF